YSTARRTGQIRLACAKGLIWRVVLRYFRRGSITFLGGCDFRVLPLASLPAGQCHPTSVPPVGLGNGIDEVGGSVLGGVDDAEGVAEGFAEDAFEAAGDAGVVDPEDDAGGGVEVVGDHGGLEVGGVVGGQEEDGAGGLD